MDGKMSSENAPRDTDDSVTGFLASNLNVKVEMTPNDFPEHKKMMAVQQEAHIIGEFLEIMQTRHEAFLANLGEHGWSEFHSGDIEKILYAYFDIDGDKIQTEKEAMVAQIQRAQESANGE